MVIYEVTAEVEPDLVAEYERYMRETHIPDVLASDCFGGASMMKAGDRRFRVAYWLKDEATLSSYLERHAPALRADFARRFPTGVELSRDVWHVIQRWPG